MANIKINYLDKQQQQIKALNEEEQKHLVGGSSEVGCCLCGVCAGESLLKNPAGREARTKSFGGYNYNNNLLERLGLERLTSFLK